MILPIITAVTREVFGRPRAATSKPPRRSAPRMGGRADDGVSLRPQRHDRRRHAGLGRALGETVAVLIILRTAAQAVDMVSLFDGGYTFASKIASAAAEFSAPLPTGAYIAAGFVLFVLTFIVNAIARASPAGRVSGGDGKHARRARRRRRPLTPPAPGAAKKGLATSLVTASFAIAVVPLVWVLSK